MPAIYICSLYIYIYIYIHVTLYIAEILRYSVLPHGYVPRTTLPITAFAYTLCLRTHVHVRLHLLHVVHYVAIATRCCVIVLGFVPRSRCCTRRFACPYALRAIFPFTISALRLRCAHVVAISLLRVTCSLVLVVRYVVPRLRVFSLVLLHRLHLLLICVYVVAHAFSLVCVTRCVCALLIAVYVLSFLLSLPPLLSLVCTLADLPRFTFAPHYTRSRLGARCVTL